MLSSACAEEGEPALASFLNVASSVLTRFFSAAILSPILRHRFLELADLGACFFSGKSTDFTLKLIGKVGHDLRWI